MEKNTIENLTNYIFSVQSLIDRLNIMQTNGKIDFTCANEILEEIKSIPYPTWGKYYVMFHDIHNS